MVSFYLNGKLIKSALKILIYSHHETTQYIMNKEISFQKNIVRFGIPILIFTLMILIVNSSWFTMNPDHLALGVTADLVITTPIIYFLLIRNSEIPKFSVVPVLVQGILLCTS